MVINNTNFSTALEVLIKEDEVFEQMKIDHPSILADLTSYKNNPNCSCRGRVNKYFQDLVTTDPTALSKYIKDNTQFLEKFKNFQDERAKRFAEANFSGRVFTIKKGEESWSEFSKQCMGKNFRSFYILDKGEDLEIYFL